MRLDLLQMHLQLSRRDALRFGAAGATAAGLVAAAGAAQTAEAASAAPIEDAAQDERHFDDTMFDPEAVLKGHGHRVRMVPVTSVGRSTS